MNTLEKICLCSVARNASCYEIEDFKALNVYVLQQLVSYLGTYQLNRLHDVFVKAGVEVERVWKSHVALHWNRCCDFPATIFKSDDVRGNGRESRRVYLERLFQKIIGDLYSNSETDEPEYITKLKQLPQGRHGICLQCVDSTALDRNVLQRELPQYAVHVRVLTISATSPMIQYLLKRPNLLKILQRTVHRLCAHKINAHNFAETRELVRLFVQEGSVSAFSLCQATDLPSGRLEDLMRLVSGQQADRCLGSLSATVDFTDAEVERARAVEDQACMSTEVMERGRNGVAGHDDVNIPHTMIKVDEGKNLTRTDEMNQVSEDSVASSYVLADNDGLDDVALTTSSSNSNSSRSCLRSSVPGDPRSLCSANGLSGASIKTTGCNASVSPLRNSRSGFSEDPGNAVISSETSSTFGSGSLSRSCVLHPRSCTFFSLQDYCGFYIDSVFLRVLRNWTTLQKLCLSEVSECCADQSCRCYLRCQGDFATSAVDRKLQENIRDDFRHFLYRAVQSNQLTHIVLYQVDLWVDYIHIITSALLSKKNDRPLEEMKISLTPHYGYAGFRTLIDSTEEFFGTVCLDFYDSYVANVATRQLIMSWLRRDRALRCLSLPRFRNPGCLTTVLQVLEYNQRIEELRVNTNKFDPSNVSSVISVLQSCPSLRKLRLIDCSISKELVDGKLFVEAISMHPTLRELDLRQNNLEDVGCDLLKAICLGNTFFNSLNLSFNEIEGKLLFETCQEIQTELRKRNRSRFPLSVLDLSGNIFHLEWRNRLVQTLLDWVDVFVVQDPPFSNLEWSGGFGN